MLKPIKILNILALIVFASGSIAVSTKFQGPNRYNPVYTETVTDIKVKVLGGYVTINRTWDAGKWVFNQNWLDLALPENQGEFPSAISRGSSQYSRQPINNSYHYVHDQDPSLTIIKTDWGFQWRNRMGDTIDYATDGTMLGYANREQHRVSFLRDNKRRIEKIQDHHGATVLTYVYQNDDIYTITDYSNRQVIYTWENNELTKVTDVRSNAWHYEYATLGGIKVIKQKTNPENEVLIIKHNVINGTTLRTCYPQPGEWVLVPYKDPITGETRYRQEYRTADNQTPRCISQSAPSMTALTELLYEDGKFIKYSYNYNSITGAYSQKETNSDGVTVERHYGLDGKLHFESMGGLTNQQRLLGKDQSVIIDAENTVTRYQYDRFKNTTRIDYPNGAYETFEYHPGWNLITKHRNRRGSITINDYTDFGSIKRITTAKGTPEERMTDYEYDTLRRLEFVTYKGDDEIGDARWQYGWDAKGNLATIVDPLGHTTTLKGYSAYGKPETIIDRREKIWSFKFDEHGNINKRTSPLGHVTDWVFNKINQLQKTTELPDIVHSFEYDPRGYLESITNPLGHKDITKRRFDGNLSRLIDGENHTTTLLYDTQNRLKQRIGGEQNVEHYYYLNETENPASYLKKEALPHVDIIYGYNSKMEQTTVQLTSKDGEHQLTSTSDYTSDGLLISTEDAEKNLTSYTYNRHGQHETMTNAKDETITLTYNKQGLVSGLINARMKKTQYHYNARGELIRETFPLGQTKHWDYDKNGNVNFYKNGLGQVIRLEYNDDNFLRYKRYYENETATAPSRVVDYQPNNRGLNESISQGNWKKITEFDKLGRVLSETTNFGNFSKTWSMTYTKNGQIKTYTDPENLTVTYSYDKEDRLYKVDIPNQGAILVTEWLESMPLSATFPGGSKVKYTPDPFSRLKSVVAKDPAQTEIFRQEYTYNDAHQLATVSSVQGNDVYTYSKTYQLEKVEHPFATIDIKYDENGNRKTVNNVTWINNNNDQLTNIGQTEYRYNDHGDVTHIITPTLTTEYKWDIDNRLTSILNNGSTIASYEYNPMGQRTSKTVNGITTFYLTSNHGLLGEYSANGDLVSAYHYHPQAAWGTTPMLTKQNGSIHYYLYNYSLMPLATFNRSGKVTWRGQFDAFGQLNAEVINGATNNLRYPGQYFDAESGLIYNWHRYYNPTIGRYISRDPIGLHGGLNPYIYTNNNPLNISDNTGELWWIIARAVAAQVARQFGRALVPKKPGLTPGIPFPVRPPWMPIPPGLFPEPRNPLLPRPYIGEPIFKIPPIVFPKNKSKTKYKWARCTSAMISICKQICESQGKSMESCRYRKKAGPGIKDDVPIHDLVNLPNSLSCSCTDEEESCEN